MNSMKSFALFALSLSLLVLGAAFSSALSFSASSVDVTIGTNATVVLTASEQTDVTPLTFIPSTVTHANGAAVTFGVSPSTSFTLSSGVSQSLNIFIQSITGQFPFGTYSTTLNATGTNATGSVSASIPVRYVQSFCKAGARGGNLSIRKVDISSSGDEDEEWILADNVDVEVKVENIGDNDLDDVQVELGLYDSAGRNVVNDLDFTSRDEEQADIGSLNDGDDETVNFEFKVPADFDTGSYKLVVKVYSEDEGETRECADTSDDLSDNFFQTISVDNEDQEERFVIVDEIRLPEQIACGETVTGTFKVFNIGDEDQDQVLITMKNTQLGLNQEFEIREDLDKGDDDTLDFSFDVPANAQDGTYAISFKTFYNYDDGDYEEESEDDFVSSLRVIGCRTQPTTPGNGGVSIDAELDSDAQAGSELVVRATISNDGDTTMTVRLDADGYDTWASLGSISPRTITLSPGDSKTVRFTFDVDADVTGTESFLIKATSDSKVETQSVEVDFGDAQAGSKGFSFSGSGLIWIIALINVVLIALIIVVAVRLSRR